MANDKNMAALFSGIPLSDAGLNSMLVIMPSSDHRVFKDYPSAASAMDHHRHHEELLQTPTFNVRSPAEHNPYLQERSSGLTLRSPLDPTQIVVAPFNSSNKGEIHPSFESPLSQRTNGWEEAQRVENSSRTNTYTDGEPDVKFDGKGEIHPSFKSPLSQWTNGWEEAQRVENSSRTNTYTDGEPDVKFDAKAFSGADYPTSKCTKPTDGSSARNCDAKTLRRLAQNREAARKSRLRKKAYVQQLENSRMRLNHLEQEFQQARQQGLSMGGCYSMNQSNNTNEALAFDMNYAHWLEEQNRLIIELRAGIHNHMGDNELRISVDSVMVHYEEIFQLKSIAARADVFHLISGMWKSPAERCFLWIGGYQPSGLLKIIIPHVEPLTEQQVLGIFSLQQSSQQAEDALTQGMDTLLHSLTESLSGSLALSGHVPNYMGQMSMAMSKLGTFESFIRQADHLRQQTLQQLQRILTTRQLARALLAIHDFFSRLRALSSLWLARPRG